MLLLEKYNARKKGGSRKGHLSKKNMGKTKGLLSKTNAPDKMTSELKSPTKFKGKAHLPTTRGAVNPRERQRRKKLYLSGERDKSRTRNLR